MSRVRATTPVGDGELLLEPSFARWEDLARGSAKAALRWDFTVGGMDARSLRTLARAETLAAAGEYCARLGIPVRRGDDITADLIVATGHQPEIYHAGVWAKDFVLQRIADASGATALDIVVDSDGFESAGIHAPCLQPGPGVCRAELARGSADGCYAFAPVPPVGARDAFRRVGDASLATLPVTAPRDNFGRFCDQFERAAAPARNLAEFLTSARRGYEAEAGTDYLEMPVTAMSRSRSFAHLVCQIAFDAPAFAAAYNAALGAYRERTGTRSAAQPFPDLVIQGDSVELPLWHLGERRQAVRVSTVGERTLMAGDESLCAVGDDVAAAVDRLMASGVELAPKALMLTLFVRMFVSDLFIHGVGGGRYDQVTDDVARRYFGVDAPAFVVASLTAQLPVGALASENGQLEAVVMALNRLDQNPDQMLDAPGADAIDDPARVATLVDEKRGLVAAISKAGADKKVIGGRIREINVLLTALLAPVKAVLVERMERLKRERDEWGVLTDRTYPFCLWSPREVAGMVDRGIASRASD